MSRREFLLAAEPHLIADVTLYATNAGGREEPVYLGWGCPCLPSRAAPGWDGWPLIGEDPLVPGETRRVGFHFMSGDEAANVMRKAGRFYLWEGRLVGEAEVID